MKTPEFIAPLLKTCTQQGTPELLYHNLVGLSCKGVPKIYTTPAGEKVGSLEEVTWSKIQRGKFRIFKKDDEDLYYVVIYPLFEYSITGKTVGSRKFRWHPHFQVVLNDIKFNGHKVASYLPFILMELNGTVSDSDIYTALDSPDTHGFKWNIQKALYKEIDGKLFGPFTIEEMIPQMQTKFALL